MIIKSLWLSIWLAGSCKVLPEITVTFFPFNVSYAGRSGRGRDLKYGILVHSRGGGNGIMKRHSYYRISLHCPHVQVTWQFRVRTCLYFFNGREIRNEMRSFPYVFFLSSRFFLCIFLFELSSVLTFWVTLVSHPLKVRTKFFLSIDLSYARMAVNMFLGDWTPRDKILSHTLFTHPLHMTIITWKIQLIYEHSEVNRLYQI